MPDRFGIKAKFFIGLQFFCCKDPTLAAKTKTRRRWGTQPLDLFWRTILALTLTSI
jgi:hypothetical protein